MQIHYQEVIRQLDRAGAEHRPCFFLLDYERTEGVFVSEPLAKATAQDGLCWTIGAWQVDSSAPRALVPQLQAVHPEAEEEYARRFGCIYQGLQRGDSFLANLTLRTPIELNTTSLADIYAHTKAKYKVLLPGRFVCYSPETFVRIRGNRIATYPMKGTIDASLEDAAERLLSDYKEHCEHCTIVDLMRNDLSRVAEHVRVARFKYLDRLTTSRGDILQMSSEVVGELEPDWHRRLGTLLDSLLPAGSISGAPKERTCQLIGAAEGISRGYYTGICGYYDGECLDTGVLIRFIEENEGRYYYRSGGGITINSQMSEEYQECIQKVYLPIG
ncbi:MAG: aminodeoxychorismate synthase component I [Porphyromonas sp.]|nr:aminodeoxychorismate synthase component I [Porphyromonas sp.]